jgi:hypothetical protein
MDHNYIAQVTDIISKSNDAYTRSYIDYLSKHAAITKPNLLNIFKEFKGACVSQKCEYIYRRGKNINKQCAVNIKSGSFCSKHSKHAIVISRTTLETDLLNVEDEEEVEVDDVSVEDVFSTEETFVSEYEEEDF